jgi:hypothetical protein
MTARFGAAGVNGAIFGGFYSERARQAAPLRAKGCAGGRMVWTGKAPAGSQRYAALDAG